MRQRINAKLCHWKLKVIDLVVECKCKRSQHDTILANNRLVTVLKCFIWTNVNQCFSTRLSQANGINNIELGQLREKGAILTSCYQNVQHFLVAFLNLDITTREITNVM